MRLEWEGMDEGQALRHRWGGNEQRVRGKHCVVCCKGRGRSRRGLHAPIGAAASCCQQRLQQQVKGLGVKNYAEL
eukprot:1156018-Pelagomonas_calceolata.AAC.7